MREWLRLDLCTIVATDTGLVACGEKLNKYLQIKRFISQIMWMGDIVIFSKSSEHYFEKNTCIPLK